MAYRFKMVGPVDSALVGVCYKVHDVKILKVSALLQHCHTHTSNLLKLYNS